LSKKQAVDLPSSELAQLENYERLRIITSKSKRAFFLNSLDGIENQVCAFYSLIETRIFLQVQ
jgi:hypothetical protein